MLGEIGRQNIIPQYCQYLLSSQINYTLTNFADHSKGINHDFRMCPGKSQKSAEKSRKCYYYGR